MSDVTYTAVATATGEGRNGGHTVTDDGLLDLTLAIPKELGGNGGGTTSSFASTWAISMSKGNSRNTGPGVPAMDWRIAV